MIRTFDELITASKKAPKKTVAVAVAQDDDVLRGVEFARDNGLINAILVGNKKEIEKIAENCNIDLNNYEIIDEAVPENCCKIVAELIASGKAHIFMKGLVETATVLKAVLNKDYGLRGDRLLSHVSMFTMEKYDRMVFVTDAAMNLLPTLEQKKEIIENAVFVAHKLGIENPNVAPICAVEKFNPKMPASVDAAALHEMNERGEISGCYVSGPVSLDLAMEKAAAAHKGYNDKIGGAADILLVPNIEAGNVLYKSIVYFAGGKVAGTVVGAKCPVVITSRADSNVSKFYSIATAVLLS